MISAAYVAERKSHRTVDDEVVKGSSTQTPQLRTVLVCDGDFTIVAYGVSQKDNRRDPVCVGMRSDWLLSNYIELCVYRYIFICH